MAQYQRFLSYLFEYEGDQKKENCGFAKIEIRGDVQRIFLSVKNNEQAEILHVFGFYHTKDGCDCVPLGRMVVKNGKKLCVTKEFLTALSNKYPVYYSPGNHEIRMPDYEEYKNFLTDLGITYLENEQVYLPEYDLTIAGLDLPEYYYHKCWQKRTFTKDTMDQTAGFNTQKGCQLLLAHNPEYIPVYRQWGAEITCSGHLHGGIMILPFLGGVLSPSLRLFPTYDQGVFREDGAVHIVSRGLGLHHLKFRFFNTPELSVINFTCTRGLK